MLFHEYLLSDYTDDKVILKVKQNEYTYKEIIEQVTVFEQGLRNAIITKSERVMILMENGLSAICMQLACSRLGVIYIPVSPYEPANRIQKIIEVYEPVAVLTEDDNPNNLLNDAIPFCNVTKGIVRTAPLREAKMHDHSQVTENDTLYIISTSGTTGNPKGIPMTHKGVLCFFNGMLSHCRVSTSDNIGTIAPLQFDLSLLDLGLAWGSKACFSVLSQALAYTPKKLIDELIRLRVTQFHSVPTVWTMIIGSAADRITQLTELKAILYAGDKFPVQNIMVLQQKLPGLRIINCFGPTECIAFSFYDIPVITSPDTQVSIGKGYPGNIFYLVDDNDELITAVDVPGELWVSNGALFNGYWNNEALSREKLTKDMFTGSNTNRVYKTGDLMSRAADGNYYFHGRKDSQIKINGNRVELDEIEQVVQEYTGVVDSVAVYQHRDDNPRIILFLYAGPGQAIAEESIRSYCRSKLPAYMVPAKIVITAEPLPVNVNGKTDRKKLLEQLKAPVSYNK
ncbi:MAG: AMP-binding protein [Niastella sp.]|uniref:AMP-binding protein n=1 Tax=Niastella sp. TaxID=1869183 RepID=UPI00389A3011